MLYEVITSQRGEPEKQPPRVPSARIVHASTDAPSHKEADFRLTTWKMYILQKQAQKTDLSKAEQSAYNDLVDRPDSEAEEDEYMPNSDAFETEMEGSLFVPAEPANDRKMKAYPSKQDIANRQAMQDYQWLIIPGVFSNHFRIGYRRVLKLYPNADNPSVLRNDKLGHFHDTLWNFKFIKPYLEADQLYSLDFGAVMET